MAKTYTRRHGTIRDHSAEANLFARRTFIVGFGVLALCMLLFYNLYYLQVVKYQDYQTRSNGNRIKVIPVAPNRGLIFDREGRILAENKPVYALEVIPEKVADIDATINDLAQLLAISDEKRQAFYDDLKYHRKFRPITLISRMSESEVALFVARQHEFPGVSAEARLKRFYPYGDLLTHTLGYVGKLNKRDQTRIEEQGRDADYVATFDIGKIGLERYYEDIMHGKPGYEEVEVNNQGRIIRSLNFQPPTAGTDLRLSLDVELQRVAQQALGNSRGAVAAIDPRDGGVLALYSNPSYDPNLFVHGISVKAYRALLESRNRPLINRATQGQYPPASTVKPHLALLGLDSGAITAESKVYDPGYFQIPNVERRWRDHVDWGHGHVDVRHAIEVSCDTYFYDMAYRLGIDNISEMMAKFGFGETTGLDILEESAAILPSRGWKRARHNQPWYAGDTISIGIGQSFWTTTPLQLTQSVSILVNRGQIITPHLLSATQSGNLLVPVEIETKAPIVLKNEQHWDVVLDAMYGTVNRVRGSAFKAFAKTNYVSAGKTGTAQVFSISEDQEYDAKEIAEHLRDNAMYVGYAPYDEPQIVIAVAVENSMGGGGSQAAPIARKLFDYYLDTRIATKAQDGSGTNNNLAKTAH